MKSVLDNVRMFGLMIKFVFTRLTDFVGDVRAEYRLLRSQKD